MSVAPTIGSWLHAGLGSDLMNDDLGLVTVPRGMLPLPVHPPGSLYYYLDRVMLKYVAGDLARMATGLAADID